MPAIRPISDLRNNFAEISREIHETSQPVFLTKNGVGTMVVMSMEAYEARQYESEVYNKLREAELEAMSGAETFRREDVMASVRAKLQGKMERA